MGLNAYIELGKNIEAFSDKEQSEILGADNAIFFYNFIILDPYEIKKFITSWGARAVSVCPSLITFCPYLRRSKNRSNKQKHKKQNWNRGTAYWWYCWIIRCRDPIIIAGILKVEWVVFWNQVIFFFKIHPVTVFLSVFIAMS